MGGCVTNVRSPKTTLPFVKYCTNLELSSKGKGSGHLSIAYTEGIEVYPSSTPEFTFTKNKDVHFSPTTDKKVLSVSKLCLNELTPQDEHIRKSSVKFLAENWPMKEVKAVAPKIFDLVTDFPKLKDINKRQLAQMRSKSQDENICVKKNIVEIPRELGGDPKNIYPSNCCPVSVDGKQTLPQGDFELSGFETGASETIWGVPDSVSGLGDTKWSLRSFEYREKMKNSDSDMLEFSKEQVILSRLKSTKMFGFLENMPSLTQSLAKTKRANLNECSIWGCNEILEELYEDIGLKSLISEIDELDVKICKSTQKLTELRRRSLNILTGGCYSGAFDQSGKKFSFVSLEKEIIRWQDHKKKLVEERNRIITKLHEIISTPLIYSPTKSELPRLGDTTKITELDFQIPSNSIRSNSITESLSSVSNLCLTDIIAEADLSGEPWRRRIYV